MPLMLGCHYVRPEDRDPRRIPLAAVMPLKELYIPSSFDAEKNINNGNPFPGRMLCNNRLSCCLVSAIANYSLTLEYIEQRFLINVTDKNVEDYYKYLSGGKDEGLYCEPTMNSWHNEGWDVQGGRANAAKVKGCWHKIKPTPSGSQHLNIYAFAALDAMEELAAAVYYLGGVIVCVRLTQRDEDLFEAGEEWSLRNSPGEDYIGGHAMYVPAFNADRSTEDRTWGKRQHVTEDWLMKRKYDIRTVVDDRDNFLSNSPIDREALKARLLEIEKL